MTFPHRTIFIILLLVFNTAAGCTGSDASSVDTETSSLADDTGSAFGTSDTDTIGTYETDSKDTSADEIDSDTDYPATWGWISVIEWNDTCDQWYTKTDWAGGVRAYFAEEASYPRSLPHTLDFIPQVASEGNCKLYDAGIIANCNFPEDCFMCVDINFECVEDVHWCDQDQQCHADDNIIEGVCRDLPPHWNLGTITLEGLKEAVTLTPDEYDRYYSSTLANPNDLFDDGDVLTAKTAGGKLPPLTFSTKGVAPLEISDATIELQTDRSVTVEWTPADPDSRIQIALNSGSHDPNPLTASIVCDVPDSDGSVTISAALINGFLSESCPIAMMKCSRITRYTREVKTTKGKEIELFVGSARNLRHDMWMAY